MATKEANLDLQFSTASIQPNSNFERLGKLRFVAVHESICNVFPIRMVRQCWGGGGGGGGWACLIFWKMVSVT